MSAVVHYPFPVAVHSYFALKNRQSSKAQFMSGEVDFPDFTYRLHKTEEQVNEYKKAAAENPEIACRLDLVLASLRLRNDAAHLEAFRAANEKVYTAPKKEYALAIVQHYGALVKDDRTQRIWDEVQELLGEPITPQYFSVGPQPEEFEQYRAYLHRYTPLASDDMDCVQAIRFQLKAVALDEKGWELRKIPGDSHARTHHGTKSISIGTSYLPRSNSAPQRIAIHEVVGHALRGPQVSLSEAEGVAIMLEQLTGDRFKMRRSYRYLAIALGWGVMKRPMHFREVYEIIWRLMVLGGKTFESAKSHAYDECCRAFRGGRPDIAGAVFLKDAVYFDANTRIWEVLVKDKLSYNGFIDVIEGRRALLS